jgi:hypothetical protein
MADRVCAPHRRGYVASIIHENAPGKNLAIRNSISARLWPFADAEVAERVTSPDHSRGLTGMVQAADRQ